MPISISYCRQGFQEVAQIGCSVKVKEGDWRGCTGAEEEGKEVASCEDRYKGTTSFELEE